MRKRIIYNKRNVYNKENMENEENMENKEEVDILCLKELQDNNFEGYSLSDITACFRSEIERNILNCGSETEVSSITEGKAKSFKEKYINKSYLVMPEIDQIINIITKRTSLKKYQVLERLILNGLKYTNFNK